jgi:crotonobetainyl-CoA:carnitine CoA-transferase CaiB-like acyl-CoA transferase
MPVVWVGERRRHGVSAVSPGPLKGVRVLDLSRLLPGGFATLTLADLGADVVKIEEPGSGDYIRWMPPTAGGVSTGHVALNRNKRSVTLNLKEPPGRDVFLRLVSSFDVLVESFRPGVMDRLGVGWRACRDANPRLIYCAITGFGQEGPLAAVAGHDINYIGYAGALAMTGTSDGPPVIPGLQIGDLGGGGMSAVISILAALHRRAETGSGDFCDVSMTDGVVSWLSIHAAAYLGAGVSADRGRGPLSGGWPCYRVYPAADGYITVGALEPQFWSRLCEAIGRNDLAGDAFATGERRDEVIAELESIFSTKRRAEWLAFFAGADVCVGPVNELGEALADDAIVARGLVVDHRVLEDGFAKAVATPVRLAGAPADVGRLPPPDLGEHTTEVLGEIGLTSEDVDALRGAGVV